MAQKKGLSKTTRSALFVTVQVGGMLAFFFFLFPQIYSLGDTPVPDSETNFEQIMRDLAFSVSGMAYFLWGMGLVFIAGQINNSGRKIFEFFKTSENFPFALGISILASLLFYGSILWAAEYTVETMGPDATLDQAVTATFWGLGVFFFGVLVALANHLKTSQFLNSGTEKPNLKALIYFLPLVPLGFGIFWVIEKMEFEEFVFPFVLIIGGVFELISANKNRNPGKFLKEIRESKNVKKMAFLVIGGIIFLFTLALPLAWLAYNLIPPGDHSLWKMGLMAIGFAFVIFGSFRQTKEYLKD